MAEIRLNIDGREVTGFDGQTILDIARENSIDIPTLCHDDRVKMYGSCGLCVVEQEGSPRLLRACSTMAQDGAVLFTNTEKLRASRRTALELLLSDHTGDCRPPCVLACPAQTDCQGYVGLIANGEYKEALKLIKDKLPLPASIGRVCPHPCEEACRRQLVEEPISIAALKAFVGDKDIASGDMYTGEVGEPTGKRVAIVGGGPGGLSAAYFLRLDGHHVSIYDKMPQMGGMLRYGIPEYRLPKRVLDVEIESIRGMGVNFHNNVGVGSDVTLDYLRKNYDAVIVAIGAWQSAKMRLPGEELEGVVGGIDFLRDVTLHNPVFAGRRIAVVGGGNTAMDACRTAVRLGASDVCNIYRRSRDEMPAEDVEIIEAEEEGVVFKFLTNPVEFIGEGGKLKAVRLQKMELGEPDASGRRSPMPIEGEQETLEVDTVIIAIGQRLAPHGFEQIEMTKWNMIAADEQNFLTSIPGVFAIGDATNKGPEIAITTIGEAKKAAAVIDRYLDGEEFRYEAPYLVTSEVTVADFADRTKQPREKMPHRSPEDRRRSFLEVNFGLSEEQAQREASRCLECGCHDYFECKLIDYANRYKVKPEKFDGQMHDRYKMITDPHPFIHRNPDKCILCGLCVRVCDEVVGATALGLVDRGFDTIVKPALDIELRETDCIACGQCVAVCPTGALTETMMIKKQVPVHELTTDTMCSFCSVGCKTKLTTNGDMILRALPRAAHERDALLCMKGRFGFGEIAKRERVTLPRIKSQDGLHESSCDEAYVYATKKLQSLQTQYGDDCIAVAVSDRLTSEEAFLIKEYANKALHTSRVVSLGRLPSGLADVLGRDASTVTLDEVEQAGVIVAVGMNLTKPHAVAGMKVRRAVQNGAQLLLIDSDESYLDELAAMNVRSGGDLSLLKGVLKAVLDAGRGLDLPGRDKLVASLAKAKVSDDAKAIAERYMSAKKAVIMFEKNRLTRDAARLLADLALVCGHTGAPRSGLLQLLPGANAQGLADLGIAPGDGIARDIKSGAIKGLFIFGEDVPTLPIDALEFLAVADLHMTQTASQAGVVFPMSSFAETDGHYTSADGTVGALRRAVADAIARNSFALIGDLAREAGYALPYRDVADAHKAIARLPVTAGEPMLLSSKGNALLRDAVPSTNELYVSFMEFAQQEKLQ